MSAGERAALAALAQDAADAAMGDSNDTEIELLREALEAALSLLGMTMPEPRESWWEDEA